MPHPVRLRQLSARMRSSQLPALLLTDLHDIRYLTGFTGSNGAVVILTKQRGYSARLFTDGRYTAQAKQEVRGATVRIAPKSALAEAVAYAAKQAEKCGYGRTVTTVASFASMKAAAKKAGAKPAFFQPFDNEVRKLREIKDTEEIQLLRQAAVLTTQLYESLLTFIQPGQRERDIAAELEHRARLAGAEAMSFETIVAAGPRGSKPHARASDAPIQPGDLVTLDFGILLNGYCSDMTRTFAIGYPDNRIPPRKRAQWIEQRQAFEAVLAAQQAAVAAVRPGVTCGQVDHAARSILQSAGLAKWFTHSTGHGLGLEIHESPRVAKDQTAVLQPGMVVTIEPGVYLPGRFGLRIEDTVLVTDTGVEILTPTHKGWLEL